MHVVVQLDAELSQDCHPNAHELPAGLIFVCADDDLISRIVVGKFIERARADRERSLVLGDAFAEVAALPETVAKLAAAHGDARVIVHLDQQMVWDEESGTCAVFGTHLCRRLRDEVGFTGIIIVVSADDAPEAQIEYIDAGADVCFGKGKASLDALRRASPRSITSGSPQRSPTARSRAAARRATTKARAAPRAAASG